MGAGSERDPIPSPDPHSPTSYLGSMRQAAGVGAGKTALDERDDIATFRAVKTSGEKA